MALAPSELTALPKRVLILGSSALTIGQAGEFDYSGSQAIKALREEGVATVLINPNIATIQTSEGLADEVYFLPVTPEFVERIIEKEKPDGILLGFGGQTALNCGVALHDSGVLERHGVRVLGTPVETIRATEDRALFNQKLAEIGVKVPRSRAVHRLQTGDTGDHRLVTGATGRAGASGDAGEPSQRGTLCESVDVAAQAADEIGYPVMLRAAFALGGLGSGMCADRAQLIERARAAFAHAPQVLIEEWLNGWKEVEYEVVRDRADNCITVCNMENVDPLGIHTGESIVVAPSQTLTDRQYHMLREISIRVIRHLGVVGECNIQFGLDPHSDDYRVIEVNARLSRSSALASKATGYPLAFVAAKLALGQLLTDIPNKVTGATRACFEPALDYVVVKAPRWDLKKFRGVSTRLGSAMKSVGEVMAIGRTFEEALQKSLRMLEVGQPGVVPTAETAFGELDVELAEPTDRRIFAVARAFQLGYSVDRVAELTAIDRWFLHRIRRLVEIAGEVERVASQRGGAGVEGAADGGDLISAALLLEAKEAGFADAQIAALAGIGEDAVRQQRVASGIVPCVKQIDTLAGEYPAKTNYLYLTYQGTRSDVAFDGPPPVLVLGSGAYRIGSSVEFDWCCVNTVRTLRRLGHRTIMLNCNPETVSTDYDECDRLYFDEITVETIREIAEREKVAGVVVSVGGQTPNNLATKLAACGIPLFGTAAEAIDRAENRHRFSALCDELGIHQPPWAEVTSSADARAFAQRVGYPVLVRPSYVLSGAAMAVAENEDMLDAVLERAADVSREHPTVITQFITGAKEIEIDAVAADGEIVAYAISEHIENAGVHSGDATIVLPPQRTYLETTRRAKHIARRIAAALRVSGPFNIQFMARDNHVMVIECNLRASRSMPFVSKVFNVNFIELATRAIVGRPVKRIDGSVFELDHVGVKAPQFSFMRLAGADPVLGVEMASTGEVGCIGEDFEDAFLKAMLSVGYRAPIKAALLSTGPVEDKAAFLHSARDLAESGVRLFATQGTAAFLSASGVAVEAVQWPLDEGTPNALELIRRREVELVINIPKDASKRELENDYMIRRAAIDAGVPLITNIQLAHRFAQTVCRRPVESLDLRSWREYGGRTGAAADEAPLFGR